MKKLLIGLFALGSISAQASEIKTSALQKIICERTDDNSIRIQSCRDQVKSVRNNYPNENFLRFIGRSCHFAVEYYDAQILCTKIILEEVITDKVLANALKAQGVVTKTSPFNDEQNSLKNMDAFFRTSSLYEQGVLNVALPVLIDDLK